MLERMWRKVIPPTLLVGIQVGTATLENSVDYEKQTEDIRWEGGGVLG